MISSFCVKPSILSLFSKKFHSVSFFGKQAGEVQKKSRKRRCYPVFCGFLILFRVSVAYAFTPLYSSETVSFLRPLARRAANTLRPLFVFSLSVRGLECSFHCCILFYVIILTNSGCKNRHFFQINQAITLFLSKVFAFFTDFH